MSTVTIQCFDACVFHLEFPGWFYSADAKSTKKILSYMFRFDWKNREAIETLKTLMPTLKDESLKALSKDESDLKSEQKTQLDRTPAEDRADIRRYYAAKLRRVKKYPQTAQNIMDYFESEVQRYDY